MARAQHKTAIQLRVSIEDAARLDAWRGSVSQAEAARQLILLGLAHCPCAACKGLRENPVLRQNYHTDEKA